MTVSWTVGFTRVNGRWQDSDEKGNMKGTVNGFEASDALAILGTVVLSVVHG